MDELNDLEAELAGEDFDELEIGSGAIIGAMDHGAKVKPSVAEPLQDDDEAKLAALMM